MKPSNEQPTYTRTRDESDMRNPPADGAEPQLAEGLPRRGFLPEHGNRLDCFPGWRQRREAVIRLGRIEAPCHLRTIISTPGTRPNAMSLGGTYQQGTPDLTVPRRVDADPVPAVRSRSG